MKLFLKDFGVLVLDGYLVFFVDEVVEVVNKLGGFVWVVKV